MTLELTVEEIEMIKSGLIKQSNIARHQISQAERFRGSSKWTQQRLVCEVLLHRIQEIERREPEK
jgi:hypothetical protein